MYKPLTFIEKLFTKNKSKDLIYHGKILEFSAAPAPSDVFWINLHYSVD